MRLVCACQRRRESKCCSQFELHRGWLWSNAGEVIITENHSSRDSSLCVSSAHTRLNATLAMARGQSTFGIPSSGRGRGRNTNFRGGRGRGSYSRGRGRGGSTSNGPRPERGNDETKMEDRFEEVRIRDEVDEKLGFAKYLEGPKRVGWLVNMHPVGG
jgi:hypothetical protein